MNEYITVWQSGLAGLGLLIASVLYSLGGRGKKFLRRFLASFILTLTVNLICALRGIWHWQFLLIWPLLSIGFHLGYGSEIFIEKVIKRTIYALAILLSGFLLAFVLGGNAWWVLIFHVIIGLSSIYFGTKNFLLAPAEEFAVCMVLNLGLILYPFIGS